MQLFTAKLDDQGKALGLLSQRQKVLASNIANADTPGFKARDFDFAAALADARGQGGAATTSARHIQPGMAGGAAGAEGEVKLQYRESEQPSLDGNTVDADTERAAYGRAALEYRASLSFIESKVRTMLTAITGQ